MRKRVSVLILVAAVAITPVWAQFGFSIVSDPVQEAHSASQLVNDIQKLQRMLQQYQMLTQQFNLWKQQVQNLTNKQTWVTAATTATNQVTQNRYGETINWSAAMNGNWQQMATAYGTATTRLSPNINLSAETLGSSYHLSNLATVEAMDSSNSACLEAAAQYRQSQQANQAAQNSLLSSILDETPATNSLIEQLNQVGGGSAQQTAEAMSRGTLQACLVEQQALANTIQRNNQVEALNMYAQMQQIEASNPMGLSYMSTSLNATIQ